MKKHKEIPLKHWLANEAIRLGICETAVWNRVFKAHSLPMPKLRRVNARVVYVLI